MARSTVLASPGQRNRLALAQADWIGESRAKMNARSRKQRDRAATRSALELLSGRGKRAWPVDAPGIPIRAEVMEPDGTQRIVELFYEPGDSIEDVVPLEIVRRRLRGAVVAVRTLQVPTTPVTSASNKFRQQALSDTRPAGSGSCDVRVSQGPGRPVFRRVSWERDRQPLTCEVGTVVWTEGPVDVPSWDVAGRSQVQSILTSALDQGS